MLRWMGIGAALLPACSLFSAPPVDRREAAAALHRSGLLVLQDAAFLDPFPGGKTDKGQSAFSINMYEVQGADHPEQLKVAPGVTKTVYPDYGVLPRLADIEGDLTDKNLLLQITTGFDYQSCLELRANLVMATGIREHAFGGEAVTWSYTLANQPTGDGNPKKPCFLWLGLDRPVVLDGPDAYLPLPDEHILPFTLAWQDLMHRAFIGQPLPALEPEIDNLDLPDDLKDELRKQVRWAVGETE